MAITRPEVGFYSDHETGPLNIENKLTRIARPEVGFSTQEEGRPPY